MTKKKSGPVLAVRYFYVNPYSGKEIKGKPSTTVYSPYAQARRAIAALNKGHREYLGGLFVKGVILLALSGAFVGCATTAPYIDSLHRFAASGRAIQKHLKPASDPSVEALYESFDAALSEAEKAK